MTMLRRLGRGLLRRQRIVEVAVAAFAGSLLSATLVGAHGGDGMKLHGCYQAPSSDLLVVGASDGCPSGWTAVDWSIAGPTGPAGPQGPAGPTGPAGAAGPAGWPGAPGRGWSFHAVQGKEHENSVACPAGEHPTGGGWSLPPNDSGFNVEWNRAFGDSWGVGLNLYGMRVWAVCARQDVAPVDLPGGPLR